ncbi:hypothetical protein ACFZDK_11735 [Streptomyces sp. NPDC007901]|uniref:DUF7144 family membrane protein n=1 Tax=Streptomyces sp. NPDC007901 TaxID=3364785 RepID=UPI0036F1481C
MSQQTHPAPAPGTSGGWASGGIVFAGVLLLMNGVFAILQGISALATDDVYARVHDYIYKISLTGWGWILVVLGALGVVAGAALLKGAPGWARGLGIFLAALSMIAQFMFLPYAPLWALIMIGIDFFVIWALALYLPDTPDTVGRP